jgi:hypothetical protein
MTMRLFAMHYKAHMLYKSDFCKQLIKNPKWLWTKERMTARMFKALTQKTIYHN